MVVAKYRYYQKKVPGQFLGHDGCLFQGIDLSVGVNAALETETGICLQAMAARTLADPCGIEVGALQQYVACRIVGTATLAAEHTGYAHRFLGIADGPPSLVQVFL